MPHYIYDSPLIEGRLIKRYKRFLADIELSTGELITAHCANSGSMLGLADEGNPCWLRYVDNPKRKLKYTLEQIQVQGKKVGVNTHLANHIAEAAIMDGTISELQGYETLRREVKYGENSRIDIFLSEHVNQADCYVEVKSVTLCRSGNLAEFPDAVSARGTKHLYELIKMKQQGFRAVMLYLIQYEGLQRFSIAGDIDKAYYQAFLEAREHGVETYAFGCVFHDNSIKLCKSIDIQA